MGGACSRHRAVDGFSGEILTKSKHRRNRSETPLDSDAGESPALAVHKWFPNILKPPSATSTEDATPASTFSLASSALAASSVEPQPPVPLPKRSGRSPAAGYPTHSASGPLR